MQLQQDEVLKLAKQAQVHEELCGEHFIYEFAKLVHQRGWMEGYTSCDNDNKTLTSALVADAVEDEREA